MQYACQRCYQLSSSRVDIQATTITTATTTTTVYVYNIINIHACSLTGVCAKYIKTHSHTHTQTLMQSESNKQREIGFSRCYIVIALLRFITQHSLLYDSISNEHGHDTVFTITIKWGSRARCVYAYCYECIRTNTVKLNNVFFKC